MTNNRKKRTKEVAVVTPEVVKQEVTPEVVTPEPKVCKTCPPKCCTPTSKCPDPQPWCCEECPREDGSYGTPEDLAETKRIEAELIQKYNILNQDNYETKIDWNKCFTIAGCPICLKQILLIAILLFILYIIFN